LRRPGFDLFVCNTRLAIVLIANAETIDMCAIRLGPE
jgi:hypothetical protein